MKKIAAISMLALLLYNTFGLSIAILFFKNDFRNASAISSNDEFKILKFEAPSLPYTSSWQNEDGLSGLIESEGKFYNTTHVLLENDTLYVTLKSNLNARDRFFELADKMESASHDESTQSTPLGAVKLLSDLLKIYINTGKIFSLPHFIESFAFGKNQLFEENSNFYQTVKFGYLSPPPEAF